MYLILIVLPQNLVDKELVLGGEDVSALQVSCCFAYTGIITFCGFLSRKFSKTFVYLKSIKVGETR